MSKEQLRFEKALMELLGLEDTYVISLKLEMAANAQSVAIVEYYPEEYALDEDAQFDCVENQILTKTFEVPLAKGFFKVRKEVDAAFDKWFSMELETNVSPVFKGFIKPDLRKSWIKGFKQGRTSANKIVDDSKEKMSKVPLLKKVKKTFEDLHIKNFYVLKDKETNFYVGTNEIKSAVYDKKDAKLFTKREAMKYIENPIFFKPMKGLVIEDAC